MASGGKDNLLAEGSDDGRYSTFRHRHLSSVEAHG